MRNYFICTILSILALNCNNIGFVEKAKAVANNEFGFEIFVMGGSATTANFLSVGDATFGSACSGFSGITKANCNCQVEATSRSFPGVFRAWISISGTVDAICNIQGNAVTGCSADSSLGPFIAKNQTGFSLLAENYAELSSTGLRAQLDTSAKNVYTGTKPDGRASGQDCTGFTDGASAFNATGGNSSQSGTGFTNGQNFACNAANTASFLCMRQSK